MNRNSFRIYFRTALLCLCCCTQLTNSFSQNSMTGDGFGGRSWYVAHNYQVGSYSANTVCGLDSQLYAWGGNNTGQIADYPFSFSDTAVPIPGLNHIKFYSTGYVSSAIKNDNSAWIWGYPFPRTPAVALTNVRFTDAGAEHVVFIKRDSTAWAMGRNGSGQLGNGTVDAVNIISTAVQMIEVSTAVRVAALGWGLGYDDPNIPFHPATMILLANGSVQITGGYPWFTNDSTNLPVTVAGLSNIVDIKGNAIAAYALNNIGEVFSFGSQTAQMPVGALGTGPGAFGYQPPTKLIFPVGAAPIVALSASDDGSHAFALDENGNVYGWGGNDQAQLGAGSPGHRYTPVLCATEAIDIYAGETFSYILKADSTLWAAGHSIFGSVFMNLPNDFYYSFVQLDPTGPFMHLCAPIRFGVLPTALEYFNCKSLGKKALLRWQSAEEENFDRYEVEYSLSGREFQSITSIKGKGSNNNYTFEHTPGSPAAYYRLKMIDKDGGFAYSEVRLLRFGRDELITIAPNPAQSHVRLQNIFPEDIRSVEVMSVTGQNSKRSYSSGNLLSFDVSDLFPGIYLLKVTTTTGWSQVLRFMKN